MLGLGARVVYIPEDGVIVCNDQPPPAAEAGVTVEPVNNGHGLPTVTCVHVLRLVN